MDDQENDALIEQTLNEMGENTWLSLVSATYGDALFELAVQESKVDSLYAEATDCLKVF